jgi:multidrug transporter EmrE-like cation transporter
MMAWLYLVTMVIFTNITQVLFKQVVGALDIRDISTTFFKNHIWKKLVFGGILFLLSPLLYIMSLSELPLNVAFSFTSINVVIVQFTGKIYFNEPLKRKKIIGALCILLGIVLYNFT